MPQSLIPKKLKFTAFMKTYLLGLKQTNKKKKDVLFITGDWKCKSTKSRDNWSICYTGVTGKFGLGVQNEAEQRLTEFCQEKMLIIANTFSQKTKRWIYSWT